MCAEMYGSKKRAQARRILAKWIISSVLSTPPTPRSEVLISPAELLICRSERNNFNELISYKITRKGKNSAALGKHQSQERERVLLTESKLFPPFCVGGNNFRCRVFPLAAFPLTRVSRCEPFKCFMSSCRASRI